MVTQDIEERFNQIAQNYDSQRKKFIPCFDDYYGTMTDFVCSFIPKPSSILDLGAGTGLLTKYLFNHFPESHFTLMDISAPMLEVAKERFQDLANFSFEVCDYSKSLPKKTFDLIGSALSIHHLDESDKKKLYKNIHRQLSENGCFINFDQFNPSTVRMNKIFNSWWYDHIKSGGLPTEEHTKWLKRRELDRENTIAQTIDLLKKSGFKTVECIYAFLKFGVILAMKN